MQPMRPRIDRRLIALVAAYALVLQAVLVPLSIVHADNVYCHATTPAGDDGMAPAPHSPPHDCDLCAIACGCAPAIVPAARCAVAIQQNVTGVVPIARYLVVLLRVARGLGLARAPPTLI